MRHLLLIAAILLAAHATVHAGLVIEDFRNASPAVNNGYNPTKWPADNGQFATIPGWDMAMRYGEIADYDTDGDLEYADNATFGYVAFGNDLAGSGGTKAYGTYGPGAATLDLSGYTDLELTWANNTAETQYGDNYTTFSMHFYDASEGVVQKIGYFNPNFDEIWSADGMEIPAGSTVTVSVDIDTIPMFNKAEDLVVGFNVYRSLESNFTFESMEAVPEPASVCIFSGMGILAAWKRRRRHS